MKLTQATAGDSGAPRDQPHLPGTASSHGDCDAAANGQRTRAGRGTDSVQRQNRLLFARRVVAQHNPQAMKRVRTPTLSARHTNQRARRPAPERQARPPIGRARDEER